MPCQPHIHAPGLLYHPMAQGNHGQSLCLHAADSVACFAALQPIRVRSPFSLSASVLPPTHREGNVAISGFVH